MRYPLWTSSQSECCGVHEPISMSKHPFQPRTLFFYGAASFPSSIKSAVQ